jgi:hypothetical protein
MIHLASNDMTTQACGHAYPILQTTVGVAALVRAFTVKSTALVWERGDT